MAQKPIHDDRVSGRAAANEARMAEGDRRLDAQRQLISELERNGQDASEAKIDLKALEMRQERRRARLSR